MARRMYDLDNGTEDIKVKNIITENLLFNVDPDKNPYQYIAVDDSQNIIIENLTEGIILKDGYEHNFIISDEGFRFSYNDEPSLLLMNSSASFFFPVYFSPYTTALRPTSISEGAVIYDSTLKKCILWNGTAWINLDGTALS